MARRCPSTIAVNFPDCSPASSTDTRLPTVIGVRSMLFTCRASSVLVGVKLTGTVGVCCKTCADTNTVYSDSRASPIGLPLLAVASYATGTPAPLSPPCHTPSVTVPSTYFSLPQRWKVVRRVYTRSASRLPSATATATARATATATSTSRATTTATATAGCTRPGIPRHTRPAQQPTRRPQRLCRTLR